MKRSTFFKLGLILPVAALLLASCSKKRDPFLYGVMDAYAIQQEVWNQSSGQGEMKFVPNLMAAAVSNSTIRTYNFEKGGIINTVPHFSPYDGIYETDIETNFKDELTDLNGRYTFTARTDDAQTLELWTEWNFQPSHAFSPGWKEFANNESEKMIREFSYVNGKISVKVKALGQADSYRLIIMDPITNPYGGTNLVRQWGDQFETWYEISTGMVSDAGGNYQGAEFSGIGFDNAKYDGKKVFIAAVKNYGGTYSPMPVMLFSTPKTINIDRGIFEEDDFPEPPCNCASNPALCTCEPGTCVCDPCGCATCPGN